MVIRKSRILICILIILIACTAIVLLLSPKETAYADMGPKPAVRVHIENMPTSNYLATLIATNDTEYDYVHNWIKGDEPIPGGEEVVFDLDPEINTFMARMREFTDCYYAQMLFRENDVNTIDFTWTYRAPYNFRIAVYDQVNDVFYVSDEINKVVFMSGYSATYDKDFSINNDRWVTFKTHETLLTSTKNANMSENVWYNILLFFARMIATIAVEMLLAFPFKFTKKSYGIIAITNAATQLFLNIFIWGMMMWGGIMFGYFIALAVGEFVIFVVEPIVYKKTCLRENGSKKLIVLYALIANFVSLVAGFGFYIIQGFV